MRNLEVAYTHLYTVNRTSLWAHNTSRAVQSQGRPEGGRDYGQLLQPLREELRRLQYYVDPRTGNLGTNPSEAKLPLESYLSSSAQWAVDSTIVDTWARQVKRNEVQPTESKDDLQETFRTLAQSLHSKTKNTLPPQILDEVRLYVAIRGQGMPIRDQMSLQDPEKLHELIATSLEAAWKTAKEFGIAHSGKETAPPIMALSANQFELTSKQMLFRRGAGSSQFAAVISGARQDDEAAARQVASFLTERAIPDLEQLRRQRSYLEKGVPGLLDLHRLQTMAALTIQSYPEADGVPILPKEIDPDNVLKLYKNRNLSGYEKMWAAINYIALEDRSAEERAALYTQLETAAGFQSQLWVGGNPAVYLFQNGNRVLVFDDSMIYRGTAQPLNVEDGTLVGARLVAVENNHP